MKDEEQSKDQIISELHELRKQIALLKPQPQDKTLKDTLVALVENLPNGIIVTDFEGRIVYVNKATEQTTGYSFQELIGKYPDILNSENDAVTIQQKIIDHLLRGETCCLKLRQKRRDRSIYTAELEVFPIRLGDNTPVAWASIQRDIQALQESEERYCQLFNSSNDAIFVHGLTVDGMPDKFIEVNDVACKWLGYTRQELLNLSPGDIILNDYLKDEVSVVKELSIENHLIFERELITRQGSSIFVEINARLFSFKGKPAVLSIARNIGERKRTEEELRAVHQKVLDIIESLPDATFVVDQDKRVIAWNRAIEEMTGVRKEDIIGKGENAYAVPFYGKPAPVLIDVIYDDDKEINMHYKNIIRNGSTLIAETFVPCVYEGKGSYLRASATPLYDASGNPIGAIESIRDIAWRKQMEEALLSSEKRFAKAFHGSPMAMAIITMDGRYVDVNNSFLDITGFSREELIGRSLIELNFWVDWEECIHYCKQYYKEGILRDKEFKFHKKSGEVRTGLLSLELIDIGDERCYLSLFHDITERKQMDIEMARLERLNLVGQMAAGIGHEVRNPMTTVRGFLQMFRGKPEFSNHKKHLDLMIEELDRANSIISQFLSLARDKPVDKKMSNLNTIIKTMYPLIQADAFKSDMYVSLDLKEIPNLFLDEKEIRQLILNLCRNGCEAMSTGKTLSIKTFTSGKEVVMMVRDQGKGVAPQVLDKLGTPFLTTKDDGTGLGLAVCYSVAARHNAIIEVDTSEKGTAFFIRFSVGNTILLKSAL